MELELMNALFNTVLSVNGGLPFLNRIFTLASCSYVVLASILLCLV